MTQFLFRVLSVNVAMLGLPASYHHNLLEYFTLL